MGPEKTFENKIKDFIEEQNGWYIKYFANKMTKSGIPDILACINGYFVAIEVKATRGRPSLLQLRSCNKIKDSGGFAFVLYPSGFDQFRSFIFNLKNDNFSHDMPLILK